MNDILCCVMYTCTYLGVDCISFVRTIERDYCNMLVLLQVQDLKVLKVIVKGMWLYERRVVQSHHFRRRGTCTSWRKSRHYRTSSSTRLALIGMSMVLMI